MRVTFFNVIKDHKINMFYPGRSRSQFRSSRSSKQETTR